MDDLSDAGPTLHVCVRGRVQGVGYRAFVREQARRRGIVGWVCNRPDGSVEVATAGEADALAEFAAALGRGPPGARVTALETLPACEVPPGAFEVRRG